MRGKEAALRHIVFMLIACLGVGGCGSSYLLNETIEKRGPEGVKPGGAGCYPVETGPFVSGSWGSGGGDGEVFHNVEAKDGVVTVQVHSGGQLLATRRYDQDFADSGKVDVIKVLSLAGREYEFRYWGSKTCEAVKPETE
jgi:hypothetical protein